MMGHRGQARFGIQHSESSQIITCPHNVHGHSMHLDDGRPPSHRVTVCTLCRYGPSGLGTQRSLRSRKGLMDPSVSASSRRPTHLRSLACLLRLTLVGMWWGSSNGFLGASCRGPVNDVSARKHPKRPGFKRCQSLISLLPGYWGTRVAGKVVVLGGETWRWI
jgi:hypothetical protein